MKTFGKIVKISSIVLGIVALITIISTALIFEPKIRISGWQNLDSARLNSMNRSITILDSENNVIADSMYDSNKLFTPIEKIPQHTKDAFISIEDTRFYKHSGIDYKRIAGAIISNITSSSYKEGASTITQQLVKNTHLNNEKTIKRKIQEIRISRELERKYSKDKILEMYLNVIYFGNNMYGIGSAAKYLFNKSCEELNIDESATLAGIINNPARYNPYKNPENTVSRRNLVLKQMLNNGKISNERYEASIKSTLNICEVNNNVNLQYINAVIRDAAHKLKIEEADLFKQNLTISTYLNKSNQSVLYDVMRDIEKNNYKLFNFKDEVLSHIIILENSTGNIICDYGNAPLNLSGTMRQPGSTIKPILCYAPAFERKQIYSSSHLLDEKVQFGSYSPSNYKNKYMGYVTIKDSLKHSLNIPAVKLLQSNGIEYSKAFARRCGVNFTLEDNSLALALGGMNKGMTLKEIANMYQTLANGGNFVPSGYINTISNAQGTILFKDDNATYSAFSKETAYLITDILKECAKTGTAKKLNYLNNIAAKTGTVGTSEGNSDAYCIAYSQDYTVAVWFGSKNRTTVNNINGGGIPTVTAGKILNSLKLNSHDFIKPETIVSIDIDINELDKNHKVLIAGTDIPRKNCKTEIFSINNMPTQVSYYKKPDIFLKDFNDNIFSNEFERLYEIQDNDSQENKAS